MLYFYTCFIRTRENEGMNAMASSMFYTLRYLNLNGAHKSATRMNEGKKLNSKTLQNEIPDMIFFFPFPRVFCIEFNIKCANKIVTQSALFWQEISFLVYHKTHTQMVLRQT